MPIVECKQCSENYHVKPSKASRTKYCSKRCQTNAQKRRVMNTCEHCGEMYERKQSRAEATRFCSRYCKDAYRRDHSTRPVVPCSWCDAMIERCPHDVAAYENHFCDNQCMGEWRSRHLIGKNNPSWSGGTYTDFGSNWSRVRERIRNRDQVCQTCGENGSQSDLDVHHIVPRREFEIVEHSNKEYNLVLLCRSCHKRVEHGSILCPHPIVSSPGISDEIERLLSLFQVGPDGFEPSPSAL